MAPPLPTADLDLILTQTEHLWSEVRGQRIFITGGTGFFGCWLVESFCHINRKLGLGAQATVLSRDPAKFFAKCPHLAGESAIALHAGDVRTFDLPAGEFGYMIHAATDTVGKPEANQPLALLSTILAGPKELCSSLCNVALGSFCLQVPALCTAVSLRN